MFIGFLLVYITAPKPQLIIKNPTLTDLNNTYVDDNNVCYKYKAVEVSCQNNNNKNTLQ